MLAANHIIKTGNTLYGILAKHTGQTVEKVKADCDRDNFMSPEEALAYGLIDKIIKNK
jgi:ATP-dependent Clp protease, protease subunit